MRYVYCADCDRISTNVWTERDVCAYCRRAGVEIVAGRPWQYYASTGILLAAAIVLFVGPLEDTVQRWGLFLAALVVSFAISNWGVHQTRTRLLAQAHAQAAAERQKSK